MSANMTDEIRKLRGSVRAADDALFAQQNRVRTRESQLAALRRQGPAFAEQAAALERDLKLLNARVARERAGLATLTDQLGTLVGGFVLEQTPQQLVARLDDALPCVLLPLRIETRFMTGASGGRELWVRVYPDDIAVHTHEKELTRDEADTGVEYWSTRLVVASAPDPAERERLEQGAWRSLANAYGGTRAAWIAVEIRRHADASAGDPDVPFIVRASIIAILKDPQTTVAAKRAAILALLANAHPFVDAIRAPLTTLLADGDLSDEHRQAIVNLVGTAALTHLGFDLEALKPESWSRAPRTSVLPERFVLIADTAGVRREFPFPNAVPSTLILGPNPQKLESELAQNAGDLVVGEDFKWIWDFEAAIGVGMAMRVPLPEPFASAGFDRLMVLGMRLSAEPSDHKQLLEELIDNHHYSPGGMGFIPQGTPTNHTADVKSGFSTDDAEGEPSFELETTPPVPPVAADLDKTDAQRLAEAWDVDYQRLALLANAGQRDVAHAKLMNRALWPTTIGYYLDELLQTDDALNDRIRRFFTADVVARGSLPALRVGKQPYGLLVTSAFDRWQPNEKIDGDETAFLRQVHDVLTKVQTQWQALTTQVSQVDSPGDSFAHLLNILGLQPTSVDYQRRVGSYQAFLWNLAHLMIGGDFGGNNPLVRYFHDIAERGIELTNELGFQFPKLPKLFGLLFSDTTSPLNGPMIDDVATADEEKLAEDAALPAKYSVGTDGDDEDAENRNYIGWITGSALDTLKQQKFVKADGGVLPIPAALLYRLLHRSLLLASHDATIRLYQEFQLVDASVRREQDFTNVEAGRTVTRWEFMEARVDQVMPQLGNVNLAVGDFLATPAGLARPAAELLREVRDSIAALEHLSTADLERLHRRAHRSVLVPARCLADGAVCAPAGRAQCQAREPGRWRTPRRAPGRLWLARKSAACAARDGGTPGADTRGAA